MLRRTSFSGVILAALGACAPKPPSSSEPTVAQPVAAPPVAVSAPSTTPGTEGELHDLIAVLASDKACDALRGTMAGMRDPVRRTVTGTLWIRSCDVVADPTGAVTFAIDGIGWQWAGENPLDATVQAYRPFQVTATTTGTFATLYDKTMQTVSLRYEPQGPPSLAVRAAEGQVGGPLNDARLRHAIVETIFGTLTGTQLPRADRDKDPLADRVTATLSLCTGHWVFSLGERTVTEPREQPTAVELAPGGLAIQAPLPATSSVTVDLSRESGTATVSLMCESDAETLARAYLSGGELPDVPALATTTLGMSKQLRVTSPPCPVALVVRPTTAAVFSWARPVAELEALARPPLHCTRPDQAPGQMPRAETQSTR